MTDTIDTTFDANAALQSYMAGPGGVTPDVTLRASLSDAIAMPADQAADWRRTAATIGVPIDTAVAMPDWSKRQAALQSIDTGALVRMNPVTASWLSQPENAAVSHDDVPVLAQLEKGIVSTARYIASADDQGGLLRDMGAGVMRANRGAAGVFQAAAKLPAPLVSLGILPANPLQPVAQFFANAGAQSEARAKAMSPAGPSLVGNAVSSGVQSLTGNLLTLPFALLPGGQGAVLTTMAAGQGGQSYQQAREQGLTAVQALPFAASQAAIEYATEKLPVGMLIHDLKAGSGAAKTLIRQIASEVPGEQAATVLQDLNEWAVLPENVGKPFSAYLAERPSAAASTLIATVIGVGGQVGVMKAIQTAADNAAGIDRQAQVAEQNAKQVEALAQVAGESKLRARDPDTFKAYVQSVTDANEAAPSELYISAETLANTLNQAGIDQAQLERLAPGIAAQLAAENYVPGADIRIPLAELLAADPKVTAPLVDHLRETPDAMSRAEAASYMLEQGPALEQAVAGEIGRTVVEAIGTARSDAVRKHFDDQLAAAARFTASARSAYATMFSAYYETQAARAGMSAEEFLQKYQLEITGTAATGGRSVSQGGKAPRATLSFGEDITQTPSVIGLGKNADLSSVLHEGGHFFLEVTGDLAARIQARREAGEQVSNSERQIAADMGTLLTWLGVTGTPNLDALNDWLQTPLEEKRSQHEQFARAVERYFMEGQAPSTELQSVFDRFRSWLMSIYKTLANLKSELTPDVRAVLDRMLASDQAIKAAEDARNLGPLFASAEAAGMSPDEFTAYQALGANATATAGAELSGRLLKDMRWLTGAKDKALKAAQERAAELRAEIEFEVVGEVMAEPIFQAWQFLTAKGNPSDRVEGEKQVGRSRTLDPARDNLFEAIAKLGGLNKTQLEGQWGKQDGLQSGVFGAPLLRRAGLSIEGMAERLVEAGYLLPDENGSADLAKFEALFNDQAGGVDRYSIQHDYSGAAPLVPITPGDFLHGKLNTADAKALNPKAYARITKLRMTNDTGLHPDVVAELFGFTGGDQLLGALELTDTPENTIEALTDQRMLEKYGDISSPEALQRAAERAVANEVRARVIATELRAVAKATSGREGSVDVMSKAARQFAEKVIARQKIKDVRPAQYSAAAARSAKLAVQSIGDLQAVAMHKRNQLVNTHAARAASNAQAEIEAAQKYLQRVVKADLPVEFADQIDQLLDRHDIKKSTTLKEISRRKSLAQWVESQREQGIEPDVPDYLLNEAARVSVKDLTVEEFRGLVDAVKQIEHLGRLKNRLLTAKDQRDFDAVRADLVTSILDNGKGRTADTRTPTTATGRWLQSVKNFGAAHIKAATWARIMDGGKDGGPVWERFVRGANEAGDRETTMRAEATTRLSEIMAPVLKAGKMGGRGKFFASIGRSLNRESVFAIALNTGNASNMQRLLDGEGWTQNQLQPILDTLSATEWQAVQAVWDFFEGYRPAIAAKEVRVFGREPEWIEPTPVQTATAGTLRGGYYPVKYDPAASVRAEEHADAEAARAQLKGAYSSATTRRSFTKARAEEVHGRPLLYTLSGMYGGVNDVIHDLAWHEWLIDTNRLLRSQPIDQAMRQTYGPAVVRQLKTWRDAVALGDSASQEAIDSMLSRVRQGVSVAGLGFNVMSAAMQPLGITQSIVRVGAGWVGRGVLQYIGAPIATTRDVNEKSAFMANRARTRFRELNELRNRVEGQTAVRERLNASAYVLMVKFQQTVDMPTWLGAYEKANASGKDEASAVALADQAVIDAQGGGQMKDLSAIERGGPAQKLFTVFYSFMNTALNVGVAQGMTNKNAAKTAADMALLYVVPAVLGALLKDALTPGDAGDDDRKLIKKLLAEQLGFLFGLFVGARELSEAGKTAAGLTDHSRDYSGPAGLRMFSDITTFAKQAGQGEFDDAFRKAAINLTGDLFALPSAQINRTITGAQALSEGKTSNPAALAFGFQENH